jgi:hypothetical protein
VSEVLVHHGREGMAKQSSLPRGDQEAGRERERMPKLQTFSFFLFYSIWAHNPWDISLKAPSQTHAEVDITNFLNASQFNQLDNQN